MHRKRHAFRRILRMRVCALTTLPHCVDKACTMCWHCPSSDWGFRTCIGQWYRCVQENGVNELPQVGLHLRVESSFNSFRIRVFCEHPLIIARNVCVSRCCIAGDWLPHMVAPTGSGTPHSIHQVHWQHCRWAHATGWSRWQHRTSITYIGGRTHGCLQAVQPGGDSRVELCPWQSRLLPGT